MTLALLISLLVSAAIPVALWLAEPVEYQPRHAAPDRLSKLDIEVRA